MDYNLQISVVLLLLAIGVYLYKKIEISKIKRFVFSCGVFVSILFYTLYGIANYFTGEGITESVIYYFNYGLSGAGFLAYKGLIVISLLSILLGAGFSLWLFFKKNVFKKVNKSYYFYIIFISLLLSLLFNPIIISFWKFSYSENQKIKFEKNTDFYNVYNTPEIIQISQPKNLVFIYAEGLERTYFNETIFPNLTRNLQKLESESISFTNISQDKYSHHTIAGIVANQCGFPLVSPSHAISMSGMDTYLGSAICLGDLLHKENYYLTYIGGANLDFAGKGKFFSTHKFDEIYGGEELLSKLPDKSYVTAWGLYDDSLFDLAYSDFIELSKSKKKFAMFTLTLDTHHPKGDPSKTCNKIIYKNGLNPILNSVACSDYLITKFVEKIRQSEYSNNTIIILVSDHLAMKNTATELLDKGVRKNLFLINLPNSSEGIKINKLGSTLDTGSTILPFIGYKGNIGLGRDIINRNESDFQISDIQKNLSKWEPYIAQFWDFPKIKKTVKIDVGNEKVHIDNRTFKIPILIELNNQLETTLKFEFFIDENIGLNSHVSRMNKNKSFILINKCETINKLLNKTINYSGYCLLSGRGNKEYEYIKIEKNIVLTIDDIHKLINFSANFSQKDYIFNK